MNELMIKENDLEVLQGLPQKLQEIKEKAELLKGSGEQFYLENVKTKITDEGTLQTAVLLQKQANNGIKDSEELRKEITQPMVDISKNVNLYFSTVSDSWKKCKLQLDISINEYQREQQRKADFENQRIILKAEKERRELEERAKKAESKGNEDKADLLRQQAENKILDTPIKVVTKVHGQRCKKEYTYQVDINKLPINYHIADMGLIKQDVEKLNRQIEGVKVTITDRYY